MDNSVKKIVVIAAVTILAMVSCFIIFGNDGYNPFTGEANVSVINSGISSMSISLPRLILLNPVGGLVRELITALLYISTTSAILVVT